MHLRGWLAIGLVFVVAGLALAKDRTWTSSDGRTMQGEFVRELDGDVTFLIAGKLVTIAIDKLSERDQKIVRDLAAGKEVPDYVAPSVESKPAGGKPAESKPAEAKPTEPDPFAPVPDRPEEPAAAPSVNKKKQKGTESRVWTDIFGRKGTGKFVRIFGSSVVIGRAGGPLTIDFFELSDADQTYVRELLTSRGEEDMIPVKPPPMPAEGTEPGAAGPTGNPEPASNPGPGPGAGRGPRGPGAGPPGSGMGPPGIGPGMSGPQRGPRFPPAMGPPIGSPSGTDTSTNSTPYPGSQFPPSSVSSPGESAYNSASNFINDAQRRADSMAERARRDSEQMQNQLDRALASSSANTSIGSAFQRVPVCSSCRKQVTEEQAKGSSCPHCGARWAFNHYDPSSTSRTASGSSLSNLSGGASERAVRSVILIVGAVVVVVVLCGGAIAVAMAIASASRPAKPYRSSNF
jgi:ribosomal protein L37AE/L43A